MSALLPLYAGQLAQIRVCLTEAAGRASAIAATYGAATEAETLRAWIAYAVEDLGNVINRMNEENSK